MKPSLTIAVIQSVVTGQWGYCPKDSPLERNLRHDEDSGFPDAEAAITHARSNPTMPTKTYRLTFEVV